MNQSQPVKGAKFVLSDRQVYSLEAEHLSNIAPNSFLARIIHPEQEMATKDENGLFMLNFDDESWNKLFPFVIAWLRGDSLQRIFKQEDFDFVSFLKLIDFLQLDGYPERKNLDLEVLKLRITAKQLHRNVHAEIQQVLCDIVKAVHQCVKLFEVKNLDLENMRVYVSFTNDYATKCCVSSTEDAYVTSKGVGNERDIFWIHFGTELDDSALDNFCCMVRDMLSELLRETCVVGIERHTSPYYRLALRGFK